MVESYRVDGLKTGALFGLMFVSIIDFSFYSMTTMFNNVGAMLVDMIVSTVLAAILGIVIVLTWGKK